MMLPLPCGEHRATDRLTRHERALEVQRDDAIPDLFGVVLRRMPRGRARAVDEDVDPAEAAHDLLDERIDARARGHVDVQEDRRVRPSETLSTTAFAAASLTSAMTTVAPACV